MAERKVAVEEAITQGRRAPCPFEAFFYLPKRIDMGAAPKSRNPKP